MAEEPSQEEKQARIFWDFIAALLFLAVAFIYKYGVAVNWWSPLLP